MDPVSITVAAIALIETSGAIITTLYQYRGKLRDRKEDISRMIGELDALRSVVDRLFTVVEDDSNTTGSGTADQTRNNSITTTNIKAETGSVGTTKATHMLPENEKEKEKKKDEKSQTLLESLASPDGQLAQCQKDLDSLNEKLTPKKGWKAVGEKLFWPLREGDVKGVLENLGRTKETILVVLAVDQRLSMKNIETGIAALTNQFSELNTNTKKSQLVKWLNAPDPFPVHSESRKKCHPGSGVWFLKESSYNSWKHEYGGFFGLNGKSGSGKTILCSTIIEDLYAYSKEEPATALIYFYFQDSTEEMKQFESLLRSLVNQLFNQQARSFPSHLPNHKDSINRVMDNFFSNHQDGRNDSSINELVDVLLVLFHAFKRVFLVVDALDECLDEDDLLKFLHKVKICSGGVSILVSSRESFHKQITQFCTSTLSLQTSRISEDIALYLRYRIYADPGFSQWDIEMKQKIYTTLNDQADGMFQWVFCQLETISKCLNNDGVKKKLDSLPKGLEGTYDQMFKAIDDSDQRTIVSRLLQFLAFCGRPLNIAEIIDFLAADLRDHDKPFYNHDLKLKSPEQLLKICSAFITTNTAIQSSRYRERQEDYHSDSLETAGLAAGSEIVQLTHRSLKGYLVSDQIRASPSSYFALSSQSSHLTIAKALLIYILQEPFSAGYVYWNTHRSDLSKKYPLYGYAAEYLPFHLRKAGKLGKSSWSLIHRLLKGKDQDSGGVYGAWIAALWPGKPWNGGRRWQPLYVTSAYGLSAVVSDIIKNTPYIKIDEPGGSHFSSPLQVACYRNRIEVVRLLLENGANPNSVDSQGLSCLFWAKLRGYTEVRKLLEGKGAVMSEGNKETLERLVRQREEAGNFLTG